MKTGSSVTVTCVISQGPHDLGTVFWYRGPLLVEEGPQAPGPPRVHIQTEWTDGLTSRLHIARALPTDTGNYSCVPTTAESASVNVHVISGQYNLFYNLQFSDRICLGYTTNDLKSFFLNVNLSFIIKYLCEEALNNSGYFVS